MKKMLLLMVSLLLTASAFSQTPVSNPLPNAKVTMHKEGGGYYADIQNTGSILPILPDVTVRKLLGTANNGKDYDTGFDPVSLSIVIPPGMEQMCDAADSLTCLMILPGMSARYGDVDDHGATKPFIGEKGTYCVDVKDLLTSLSLVEASCPLTLFTVK